MLCYLGDMLTADGGAGDASKTRVKCAWKQFREFSPIFTKKGTSFFGTEWKNIKSYSACVRTGRIL